MLQKLKKISQKIIYRDETSRILNYITLQISDPEVLKELTLHKTSQQNRIYWIA